MMNTPLMILMLFAAIMCFSLTALADQFTSAQKGHALADNHEELANQVGNDALRNELGPHMQQETSEAHCRHVFINVEERNSPRSAYLDDYGKRWRHCSQAESINRLNTPQEPYEASGTSGRKAHVQS
jgi:Na+-translocating ferredoxin:NAD+ oxidoreductase RnfG subunit